MAGHTTTTLRVRDTAITLRRAGSGRALLVLHGASDCGMWFPWLDNLAASHDVMLPEHPGFGSSDTPPWLDTIADLANFNLDLLDDLAIASLDLVGFDLGGWIAAELAVRNGARLSSLTLVGAAGLHVEGVAQADPFLGSDEERMRDLFHRQERATAFLQRALDPALEDTRLKNETTAARLTWAPRGHDPHLRKWLHRIKAPTLVIWGAHDRLYPKEHAVAFGNLIPGAKVTIIPGCGHLPHIEQPDAFAAALTSFLDAMRIPA